ncbi:hypothetical protein [Rathayibacter iranicus]|uniref:Uncharacterized protein n=2 Tax=Rathayibacter iranicus TaxID=59737 RepID=A0AAD1EN65_9MICO|nr:hypothetical protein [Rathayibacter iranicus]AZZ56836.1 hypothetical protein C7V51_13855 [Rathayibacter iranicus]MWV32022.1 hypothetical protein [Rathayibacter iranicus NCPPB 2253 = VKM Ac-1602]PPI58077.1 hypothetical protein C5E08_13615 [Rathayibacter iranicus]PWJ62017.1 hypothetical protein B0H03_11340 [Rathayibacter iranicus NCPPB 2253 = VKM Ac-1602]
MKAYLRFCGLGALTVIVAFILAPFIGGVLAFGYFFYVLIAGIMLVLVQLALRRRDHRLLARLSPWMPMLSWVVSVIAYTWLDAVVSEKVDLARVPGFAEMFAIWPALHLLALISVWGRRRNRAR